MKEAVLGNVINFGKTLPLFLSALVLFPVCAAAQQIKANDVIGRWVTENGDIEIEFYLTADGTYAGKIVRLADPLEKDGTPKKDHKNPDKSLRSRPVVGIVFMQNVTFDPGKGRWNIEEMYYPMMGVSAVGYMSISDGQLTVTGRKFGISGKMKLRRPTQ